MILIAMILKEFLHQKTTKGHNIQHQGKSTKYIYNTHTNIQEHIVEPNAKSTNNVNPHTNLSRQSQSFQTKLTNKVAKAVERQ